MASVVVGVYGIATHPAISRLPWSSACETLGGGASGERGLLFPPDRVAIGLKLSPFAECPSQPASPIGEQLSNRRCRILELSTCHLLSKAEPRRPPLAWRLVLLGLLVYVLLGPQSVWLAGLVGGRGGRSSGESGRAG